MLKRRRAQKTESAGHSKEWADTALAAVQRNLGSASKMYLWGCSMAATSFFIMIRIWGGDPPFEVKLPWIHLPLPVPWGLLGVVIASGAFGYIAFMHLTRAMGTVYELHDEALSKSDPNHVKHIASAPFGASFLTKTPNLLRAVNVLSLLLLGAANFLHATILILLFPLDDFPYVRYFL